MKTNTRRPILLALAVLGLFVGLLAGACKRSATTGSAATTRSSRTTELGAPPATSGPAPAGVVPADRLAWWREARFGLFIHWGPVSLKGTEISWSRANSNPLCPNRGPIPVEVYDNLYKDFNPTLFDADAWAAVAKSAGTRYAVLTAKHCDGFCLWRTDTDDYHIGNTPFRRDVCGELAEAVRRAGLRIGWYYSPMDWRDPDCRTARNADYVKRMQAQVGELLTRFGRIDLLWFDWDGGTIPWDQEATYKLVRAAQPAIVVNNRLDCSSGGLSADRDLGPNADYITPEQVIGAYNDRQPWETCMTLGTQWSWKPDDAIKTVDEVLRILAGCAGGDGNLLLNVGPMPDGRIEPRQVEVLEGVGAWLAGHGESIYGTRGGPYKPGPYGASTRRGSRIYLHVIAWPGPALRLPPLPAKVVASRVLGGGAAEVTQTEAGLEVAVKPGDRHPADTVVVLELDGPADRIAPIEVRAGASK
jgi:alpha-L-fucosidase